MLARNQLAGRGEYGVTRKDRQHEKIEHRAVSARDPGIEIGQAVRRDASFASHLATASHISGKKE